MRLTLANRCSFLRAVLGSLAEGNKHGRREKQMKRQTQWSGRHGATFLLLKIKKKKKERREMYREETETCFNPNYDSFKPTSVLLLFLASKLATKWLQFCQHFLVAKTCLKVC